MVNVRDRDRVTVCVGDRVQVIRVENRIGIMFSVRNRCEHFTHIF